MIAGPEAEHSSGPSGGPSGSLSSLIGIAGAMFALLHVHCSRQTTGRVALKTLGAVDPPAKSAAEDAIEEIANMVAGNFKSKVSTLGDGCVPCVPTIVSGEDYEVRQVGISERIECCLHARSRAIWLILELGSSRNTAARCAVRT
jgi:CheY-specific phosphatase CheX